MKCVPMATETPCKNTLYFVFSCSYLKNELSDHPISYCRKVIGRPS